MSKQIDISKLGVPLIELARWELSLPEEDFKLRTRLEYLNGMGQGETLEAKKLEKRYFALNREFIDYLGRAGYETPSSI